MQIEIEWKWTKQNNPKRPQGKEKQKNLNK